MSVSAQSVGSRSSFSFGIAHIVRVCAEKEVAWVHAERVVAVMANEKPTNLAPEF